MEFCKEMKTPLLDLKDGSADNSTRSREGHDKADPRTGYILQKSLGALLIFNFALAYYLKEEPVCCFILAFVSLEGPIVFLVTAHLYRQTYYDANVNSLTLLALPEMMINVVNVLLLFQCINEARFVIFVFTLVLSLFVVLTTTKLLFWGTSQQCDDSTTESNSLTDCQIV